MCTGKCAKCIGGSLIPFAVICMACNAILYFPGWSVEPSQNAGLMLTTEVTMFLGIIGGGVMVLIPAIQILSAGKKGCCGNRCGMFLSILSAAIGLCGSLFCLTMSVVGLMRGPVCEYYAPLEGNITDSTPYPTPSEVLIWGRPLEYRLPENNNESYIFHKESWDKCINPPDVVRFNIVLFSIMLAASSIEVILCAVQLFNGLFGVICGTCRKKDDDYEEDMIKEAKC
ncbi:transmembrane 4 L6 family member 5-like [Hyperolius riggenbachi]|uniref:transmembrane 4 L6 family member 5-like n=1 Tax=Hyperolius riggenbachi TaxID=752182 RepID=UPI0035A2B23A